MPYYTIIKVHGLTTWKNRGPKLRNNQNRRYYFEQYMTDDEIERWVQGRFGCKRDWKLVKRIEY
jgi:hypothetical protein